MEKNNRTYTYQSIEESLEKGKEMTGLQYLKAMISGELSPAPAVQTLGMYGISCKEGEAVFGFIPEDYHYNAVGTVHGGVLSTLLDTAMGCTLMTTLDIETTFTTLELKVNFLRAVTKDQGEFTCVGKIIHAGRTTALVEASLLDVNGKVYAHGVSTCLKMKKK